MRRILFALVVAFVSVIDGARANTLPTGWQAQNLEPVGYTQIEGGRAFKLSIRRVGSRWYLFVGQQSSAYGRGGFTVVDVTDAANPRQIRFIEIPNANGQLTMHGDLLIVGSQMPFAPPEVGGSPAYPFRGSAVAENDLATLWDVRDPRRPRRLSAWRGAGWGTHRNTYPGGRYAYMSAWVAGYHGQSVLQILDVSNPRRPRVAGTWWRPGQRDDETPREDLPLGFHGPVTISEDGRTLMTGYTPGLLNLDISDIEHPRVIGELIFSPLDMSGTQAIHTAIPVGGGFVHVNTEIGPPGCDTASLPWAALVDNRDPAHPRLVSHYPRPAPPEGAEYRTFCDKDGRFGPHNVNAEIHLPDAVAPGQLIYMTYFNAGLRVYDIADPYFPRETGWFLPEIGAFAQGMRGPEDVIVDTRGNVFTSMGRERGIWVLRYTGPAPGATREIGAPQTH